MIRLTVTVLSYGAFFTVIAWSCVRIWKAWKARSHAGWTVGSTRGGWRNALVRARQRDLLGPARDR